MIKRTSLSLRNFFKFRFEDEALEKEFNISMQQDQRFFLFIIQLIFLFMSIALLITFTLYDDTREDLIQRIILAVLAVLNLVIYFVKPKYSEKMFAITSAYLFVYIYRSYAYIYSSHHVLFTVGQGIGVLELLFFIVVRSFTLKIIIQILVLALNIVYVNSLISYTVYFIIAIFWLTIEKRSRRNFKNMADQRKKAQRFQKLLSDDFPLYFLIISIPEKKILFQNQMAQTSTNVSEFRSIVDSLIWKNDKNENSLDDKHDLTMSDFIDVYIGRLPETKVSRQSLLHPIFIDKMQNQCYEGKVIDIEWGDVNSIGIILSNITEKDRLEKFKKVNEYKDLVIASVSHELRTPLNGILGMIKMAMDKIKDEELMKYLENCNSCAKLLLHFVNSILDSSQIDAQTIKINPEPMRISDLTQEISSLYTFQASFKNLEFIVSCDENLPARIYTDKYRLLQILINLISNAIKFTSKGLVKLKIGLNHSRDKIQFSVTDTGIGIKPEDLKYLFKNFGKLEQADKNINARGVGLGLSISNELVRVLNNSITEVISVKSIPNHGSTFTFCIPYLNEVPTVTPYNVETTEVFGNEIHELRPYQFETLVKLKTETDMGDFESTFKQTKPLLRKRCLVVDDNSYNLLAATHILKNLNVDFTTAISGNEAIDIALKEEFELIFMDIQMPVLDGVETTKILVEKMNNLEIRYTPIIALTANGEGNKESYLKAGMVDMISKPVTQDKLRMVINKYT